MGKKTREIIDLEIKTVINELNKALADEFLASYQYWIGAQIVKGYQLLAISYKQVALDYEFQLLKYLTLRSKLKTKK